MNILVTGISGFIGSHIAAALAAQGHQVTGTYRNNEPRLISRYNQGFPPHGEGSAKPAPEEATGDFNGPEGSIETVRADLSKHDTVYDLIKGRDAVIHVAGYVSDWGGKEPFYRANILPVEYFLDAIADSDSPPKVFIHTSSISVHGFGPHVGTAEDGPYFPLITNYQRSKLESEELVTAAALPGTAKGIIRPGNVYGPGDSTTIYPIFNAIRDGRMGQVDGGRHLTCPVFIDDLVSAYLALLDKLMDNPGEGTPVYNITGGEKINWKEEVTLCSEAAGLPVPRLSAPGWLAMILARVSAAAYGLVRSKTAPDLTPYRIKQVMHDFDFSIDKARADLNWNPITDFKTGIAETAEAWTRDDT